MAKKAPVKDPEIIDVDPELVPVKTDGSAISTFLMNLQQFFQTATTLEVKARSTLARARTWTLPQTSDQDVVLQQDIRQATADQKAIADHWIITQAASRFHKMLVQHRDRGWDALEDVKGIGNRLHGQFDEQQRRRAREEDDRLRREAEERARKERERELADLEKAALKREAESPDLSDRERQFVDYYTGPYPAAHRAAQQAGYKNPDEAGARLLNLAKVQKAVEIARQAKALRDQAAAKRALPVEVAHTEVKPDLQRAAGASDRTSHTGQVLDLVGLRNAAFEGTHGIPRDLFVVDQAKLNEYARSMRVLIERWPGVRYKKGMSVV